MNPPLRTAPGFSQTRSFQTPDPLTADAQRRWIARSPSIVVLRAAELDSEGPDTTYSAESGRCVTLPGPLAYGTGLDTVCRKGCQQCRQENEITEQRRGNGCAGHICEQVVRG